MLSDYVPGIGPVSGAKLLLLGEAPFINEVKQKKPFVGASGSLLDKILNTA